MTQLSATSRVNFARAFGKDAKSFMKGCEKFSMKLSDGAESEKSVPLRQYMHETSKEIDEIVEKISSLLTGS